MNTKMLDDAINGIRPELIEESVNINQREMKEAETFDAEVQVQGVEIYRRPLWKNILVIASAFIIVGGAVTGRAFIMKNRSAKPADTITTPASVEQEAKEITVAEAEEITEDEVTGTFEGNNYDEPVFVELKLHEAPRYVNTIDEAHKLQGEHSILMQWEDRHSYRIDVKHYAELLQSGGYDINSLEAKSFIYHMMCNSFIYFDTAKGSMQMSVSNNTELHTTLDFQADLNKQESYNKQSYDSDIIMETFLIDEQQIDKIYNGNHYTVVPCDRQDIIRMTEDNYRYIDVAPPDYGLAYSPSGSLSCGGLANNELYPGQLAVGWLNNFDNWQVNGISERIGRTVAELSGISNKGKDFTVAIDIYTGIMLEYTESDNNGIISHKEMTDLQVNIPVEHIEPDLTGFTEIELFKHQD